MFIQSILDSFGKLSKEERQSIIKDNYKFKEGIYVKVNKDFSFEVYTIDKNIDKDALFKDFFVLKDYNGGYLNSNKAITSENIKKRIFSASPYCYFTKVCDLFDEICEDNKLGIFNEITIDDYFSKLKDDYNMEINEDFVLFLKTKGRELISYLIENNFLPQKVKEINDLKDLKIWIKLFFDVEDDLYIKEYQKYIQNKIFNSNEYNKKINDITYGALDFSSTFNDKKYFLKMKNMKYEIPTRVTLEQALIFRDFCFWLDSYKGNTIYVDYNNDFRKMEPDFEKLNAGYVINVIKDKQGFVIESFDFYNNKNYIKYKNENYLDYELNLPTNIAVEKILDNYFFSNGYITKEENLKEVGILRQNYFSSKDVLKNNISNSIIRNIYLRYREMLFNHFHKNGKMNIKFIENELPIIIDENILSLIKTQTNFKSICNKLLILENMRLNLLEQYKYKGDKLMGNEIEIIQNNLISKLTSLDNIATINNDKEYYLLLGQLMKYLINQSQGSSDTKAKLLQNIITCKNNKQLRKILDNFINKFSYNIKGGLIYNQVITSIFSYTPQTYDKDSLLVGLSIVNNVLYFKINKDEEGDIEDEQNE